MLVFILGLLGAAGLSVYHSVPIPATSAATTPDSATDDGRLDYITSTSLFFTDEPEADRDACVTGSNQTVCSIEHAFLNTGLCLSLIHI